VSLTITYKIHVSCFDLRICIYYDLLEQLMSVQGTTEMNRTAV